MPPASLSIALSLAFLPGALSLDVTLWQFGHTGRVAGGATTLPLVPLGTRTGAGSDNLATTYLYQVVNPQTFTSTRVDGALTTQVIPITSSRTIAVSASGWDERLDSGTDIACAFVDENSGACFDGVSSLSTTSLANSGAPFVDVIPVSAIPVSPGPTTVASIPSKSKSASFSWAAVPPYATSGSPPLSHSDIHPGAVVGAIVGGLLILALTVAVILLYRRLRYQERDLQPDIDAYGTQPRPFFVLRSSFPHAPNGKLVRGWNPVTVLQLPKKRNFNTGHRRADMGPITGELERVHGAWTLPPAYSE
ncbi:hypothetical protein MIND_00401700 [Mycena indigotica]|uniref:Uncharacterized protein n=1 Tax=Mycena indigotica TaxID=2126181 RepID=A0A8H6WA18_9AGAR|nr:uncharacterized protein MIND_00401700 [Mycena indigotica]KAF7310277.1 hypothetical protein MIND_00401700 [Mycena indigotica]